MDELLKEPEAAAYLGVSRFTLTRWRLAGKSPPHSIVGARGIRYSRSDLERWVKGAKGFTYRLDHARLGAGVEGAIMIAYMEGRKPSKLDMREINQATRLSDAQVERALEGLMLYMIIRPVMCPDGEIRQWIDQRELIKQTEELHRYEAENG